MYIVSACLAGIPCRYDGDSNENNIVLELVRQGKAIPVCPEVLGGLSTPRVPCEIVEDKNGIKKVINKEGIDCTKEFVEGADITLAIAKAIGAKNAILKSKSPSCGFGCIYDGTFSGKLKEGKGLTAELLLKHGIKVYTEDEFK
jgi:uncharacterized protein YbbK (DUF523 family)